MLTLQHFLLRPKVLALYRDAIRASRSAFVACLLTSNYACPLINESAPRRVASVAIPDPTTRKETVAWIRSEFERHRNETDIVSVPSLVEGNSLFINISSFNFTSKPIPKGTNSFARSFWSSRFSFIPPVHAASLRSVTWTRGLVTSWCGLANDSSLAFRQQVCS